MHSGRRKMRCRIQTSPDQSSFASSPEHFGGYAVFLRLCMPSHPPYTLSSLTTLTINRSTSAPVKARKNRRRPPGTAFNEGPSRGLLPKVTLESLHNGIVKQLVTPRSEDREATRSPHV